MPSLDIDNVSFSILVGGGLWQQTYASRKASGKAVFVFQRRGNPKDIRVLRNDCAGECGTPIVVPRLGNMIWHSYVDDPSLVGVREVLAKYASFDVLRYRPGKRLTIAATDRQNNAVIVKFVAKGVQEIFARLAVVDNVKHELGFTVSRPIQSRQRSNYFVQERLGGSPIDVRDTSFSKTWVQAMAAALQTLHGSSASFDHRFDTRSQRARSDRYFNLIRARFPETERSIERLRRNLYDLELQVVRRSPPLVPVHGSLHSHQWLRDGERLALVDFDRAAMGHAELDIATFLAEFDYESASIGTVINHEFLSRFDDYDPDTVLFYRVHKHLAKAFKASKLANLDIALKKTHRNLVRADALLETGCI